MFAKARGSEREKKAHENLSTLKNKSNIKMRAVELVYF